MTVSNVMLAQLYALRAHLDATILAAEAEAGIPQVKPTGCPNCGAAEDQLKDTSTFGVTRRMCQACGHEWVVE